MKHFIQTDLRPDYYEFFPRFTSFELKSRLDSLDCTLTTQLSVYNRCPVLAAGYHTGDLTRVLARVGVDGLVAGAVASTFEFYHRVTDWLMPDGITNSSCKLPTSESTWVSAPGVVALMVGDLLPYIGSRVLEIGAGTGVHGGVLLLLRPDISFTGVEPSAAAVTQALHVLPQLVPEAIGQIDFLNRKIQDCGPGDWDTIYSTCATSWQNLAELCRLSTHRPLVLQAPRPLRRSEFESEAENSWLRRAFRTYETYLADENFRQYLAISTFLVDSNNNFEEVATLYDVTFVRFEE